MTEIRADTRAQPEPHTGTKESCRLTGINRSTHHRHRDGTPGEPEQGPTGGPSPPNRLTPAERHRIVEVLNSPRLRDKAPRQVWAALLDEGAYLCSVSTMYRLLRERGRVRERRAQARHPAETQPQPVAHAPNKVWGRDITEPRGPGPGRFFGLYVMIDIYFRYVVRWEVHVGGSGQIAREFIEDCIRADGGIAARVARSDRGTAVASLSAAEPLSMPGIAESRSRPEAGNDNPYSEAAFKALEYCPRAVSKLILGFASCERVECPASITSTSP